MAFDAQMTIIAENIDILFEAIEIDIRVPFVDIEDEDITPERVAQKYGHYSILKRADS